MQIHSLKLKSYKAKKRIGRGGKKGTYSGRGGKGQSARAGYSERPTFAGGGADFVMSAKKVRGFKSNKPKNQPVSLAVLEAKLEDGAEVSPETLKAAKVISGINCAVKILDQKDFTFIKKLIFKGVMFSFKAKEKIEKAGGKIIETKTSNNKENNKNKKKD